MPRYFFHLKRGKAVVIDRHGLWLHDLEQALTEIVQSIREIFGEPDFAHRDFGRQILEIANEAGDVVLIIPMHGAITRSAPAIAIGRAPAE